MSQVTKVKFQYGNLEVIIGKHLWKFAVLYVCRNA